MKNNIFRLVIISLLCVLCISSFVYADTIDAVPNSTQERQKMKKENMLIGKITQIDANNVVISVATRKERQKKDKNPNGNTTNTANTRNEDDKYTLTGETKTINIQNADFGRIFSKNGNNANADATTNTKKTYLDYKVGDYIRITMSDETSNVAKRIREANFGSRGGKGNYQGQYKKNKENKGQQ